MTTKTLKSLMAALVVLLSLSAHAHDVEVNGIYYNINSTDKTATVTYKGTSSYNKDYSGSVVIPASFVNGGITYAVTSIGYCAFQDCSGLTAVSIPNSVTSIGGSAFSVCSGLTTVDIPNSVTSIGDSAFSGCTGLTAVSIPNSVTSIGKSTFDCCSGLTVVDIPNSVTSIGESAFSCCYRLTSVDIPNSVTSIGVHAFYKCSGLTTVDIPNSVTSIGHYAFMDCRGLTTATIPNSVTSIGGRAFYGCSGLTAVSIPNSVTSIGSGVFSNCSGLTAITVASDNPIYDSRANCNAIIETSSNLLVAGCKNTTIPNGVTSIGYEAFSGCSGLTAVNIPNSVIYIRSNAFYKCSGLTAVDIPNSITSIDMDAFYGCSGLTTVNIPNSVTSIGHYAFNECRGLTSISIGSSVTSISYAFQYCSSLKDVYCYAKEVPNTKSNAFNRSNIENATLYVPAASVDSYKAASPWSDFGIIVPIKEKCATPTISFANGKVKVTCATEGAKCVTSIVTEEQTSEDAEIDLSTEFTVRTYATAEGYEDSEVVTATFNRSQTTGDLDGDGYVNISDVTTLVNIILGK